MATYVVAARQEAPTGSLTAEDQVRQVPGVWIRGGTDPNRITIEASELAAAEIERRFGSVLLIEPEIRSQDQGLKALLASAPLHELDLDRPLLRRPWIRATGRADSRMAAQWGIVGEADGSPACDRSPG